MNGKVATVDTAAVELPGTQATARLSSAQPLHSPKPLSSLAVGNSAALPPPPGGPLRLHHRARAAGRGAAEPMTSEGA